VITRTLGSSGHGPAVDHQDGIALIRAAIDYGITFFDTAQVYGPFSNEELVGQALAPVREEVIIATKFGFSFDGARSAGLDSRPAHSRATVEDYTRSVSARLPACRRPTEIPQVRATTTFPTGFPQTKRHSPAHVGTPANLAL
jgi:aryl-alcohol dehydrogenase-like predicted oxidoreductase